MSGYELSYHQVQAMVGASSAHAGGWAATLAFLDRLGLSPGLRVLECGCGTGRTACHLARQGLQVTAADHNPSMLEKAKRRGEAEGVSVTWVPGDARSLPFEDGQFELVLAESVTIFNPIPEVVREYHRVLVPGGRVADLELTARPSLPPEGRAELLRFFGASELPTADGWKAAYTAAGFDPVELWGPHRFDLHAPQQNQARHPDPHVLADPGAQGDPRVQAVLLENMLLIVANHEHLEYLGIIATRPGLAGRE